MNNSYLNVLRLLILLHSLFLSSVYVYAHEMSNGYLGIEQKSQSTYLAYLSLQPYDLERVIGIDTNGDGQLTWAEATQSTSVIQRYIQQKLWIEQGSDVCSKTMLPLQLESISGQTLIRQPIEVSCPNEQGELSLTYNGIFEKDNNHKVLVTSVISNNSATYVIDKQKQSVTINQTGSNSIAHFFNFVYEGIIHIWIGIDHILFLIALLLTVNLIREDNQWKGQQRKRAVLKETIMLVTAFTLAHSVTLTTTALGWYTPSSRLVELGIALTVLLTAMNNIWPLVHRLGWITFGFGLLHGMGFASVFGELQAAAQKPILSIAAFNIGVEIGQLVIVCVTIPLLLLIRHQRWYPRAVMPLTSSLIAMVALNWAIQRW